MRKIFCSRLFFIILVLQFVLIGVIAMTKTSYAASTSAPQITYEVVGSGSSGEIGELTSLDQGSITLTLDKNSNIYCISSTRKLTSAEIKVLDIKDLIKKKSEGKAISIDSIEFAKVFTGVSANKKYTMKITDLIKNKDHYIYMVLQNTANNGKSSNLIGPLKISDTLAPVFINDGTPVGKMTYYCQGEITLKVNKESNIYCIGSIKKFTNDEINNLNIKDLARKISGGTRIFDNNLCFGSVSNNVLANSNYTIKLQDIYRSEIGNMNLGIGIADCYAYMILEDTISGVSSTWQGPYQLIYPALEYSGKPKFVTKDTKIDEIKSNSFELTLGSNKPCTAYYLAIPSNNDIESIDKSVIALTNNSKNYSEISGAVKGTFNLDNFPWDNSPECDSADYYAYVFAYTEIDGLTPNTKYNIYIALKDLKGITSDDAYKLQVVTSSPTLTGFVNNYPYVDKLYTKTSIKLLTKTEIACTAYYLIIPENSDTDNIDKSINSLTDDSKTYTYYSNIMGAIVGKLNISKINTEIETDISGLTLGTNYHIYVALKDLSGNKMNQTAQLSYACGDIVAPQFTGDGAPATVLDNTSNTVTTSFKVDKHAANVYCIDSTKQFTSDELSKIGKLGIKGYADKMSCNQSTDIASIDFGTVVKNVSANSICTITMINLNMNLDHYIYMVLENDDGFIGAIQGPFNSVIAPPSFVAGYPNVNNSYYWWYPTIKVAVNKACDLYCLITTDNSSVNNSINTLIYDENCNYVHKINISQDKAGVEIDLSNSLRQYLVPTHSNKINNYIYMALKDSEGNKGGFIYKNTSTFTDSGC